MSLSVKILRSVHARCWKPFIKRTKNMTFSSDTQSLIVCYRYCDLSILASYCKNAKLSELHLILSEMMFVSKFRKSANYSLDFSLSGTSAAEGEAVGDQYLCRDPNSFVQKLELKRRKFKANKNKGCFNQATRPLAWQRSHQVQVIFIRQHFNFPL